MGPMGPLGPHGAHRNPNPPWLGVSIFKKFTKNDMLAFVGSKMVKKKVEIEGAGPPWRDSQRNSAPGLGPQVPKGAMVNHLGAKRYDLGSLGVPGSARTPLGLGGSQTLKPMGKKVDFVKYLAWPGLHRGGFPDP